jgi:hypothetical protein
MKGREFSNKNNNIWMESNKRIYIVYKYPVKGEYEFFINFNSYYVLTGTNLYKIKKFIKEKNESSKKYVYDYICKDLWE